MLSVEIHYEVPSAELYKFSGTILLLPSADSNAAAAAAAAPAKTDPPISPGSLHMAVSPMASTHSNGGQQQMTERQQQRQQEELLLQQQQQEEDFLVGGTAARGASQPALLQQEQQQEQLPLQPPPQQLQQQQQQQQYAVDASQFVWRGATVRSTEWIYGLVVYTGHQTRIMKNTKQRELKYSRTQVVYNQHAVLLAIAQVCCCYRCGCCCCFGFCCYCGCWSICCRWELLMRRLQLLSLRLRCCCWRCCCGCSSVRNERVVCGLCGCCLQQLGLGFRVWVCAAVYYLRGGSCGVRIQKPAFVR